MGNATSIWYANYIGMALATEVFPILAWYVLLKIFHLGTTIAGSRKCANRRGYGNLPYRRVKKRGGGGVCQKIFF
jgi:hypothetical protein